MALTVHCSSLLGRFLSRDLPFSNSTFWVCWSLMFWSLSLWLGSLYLCYLEPVSGLRLIWSLLMTSCCGFLLRDFGLLFAETEWCECCDCSWRWGRMCEGLVYGSSLSRNDFFPKNLRKGWLFCRFLGLDLPSYLGLNSALISPFRVGLYLVDCTWACLGKGSATSQS